MGVRGGFIGEGSELGAGGGEGTLGAGAWEGELGDGSGVRGTYPSLVPPKLELLWSLPGGGLLSQVPIVSGI